MGTRLLAEVMNLAPTTLTHREAWVLAVLAADAHDDTRATQSSVEAPALLRRAKVSRPQMYAVLKSLTAKGVVKRTAAGHRNGVARYELLPLGAVPERSAQPEPAPARPPRKQPAARTTPPTDTRFDEFWSAYPRKVAKGTARTAWKKALKRGAAPAAVTAAAARHAAQWRAAHTETRFIPHPATWLNSERYDDETDPAPASQPPLPGTPRRYTDPADRGVF
ncbi:hypothetical protein ACWGH2_16370 [Streptomyces sp. NPDC054871]